MNKTSNSMLKWKTKMMIMKLTAEAFILIVLFTLDVSKGLFVATIVTINTLLTIIEYYTGCQYIKTISLLVKKVQATNPNKHLSIKKTNVYEIDSLAEEFESLNSKVADCSSKLSQIIELLNMPIAAFEYKKNEDMVYCTEGFFSVIGVENFDRDATYFSKEFFEEILNEIMKNPEPEMKEIYRIDKPDNNKIWVKLKICEEKYKKLGVIIDITQEVLEKQKIEYERDYDVLTNILNRRAFNNEVIEKLKKKDLKIGAFIMWDLDNLKYVNDTYGHDYGDIYIRKAATVLKQFEQYGGIVARRSGDEFFVFIYGFNDKSEIKSIVERVHDDVENTRISLPNGRTLKIRASTGIAWYPDDGSTYEELSRFSDFAMYKIKKTVKGSIREFNRKEYEQDSFLFNSQEDLNKLLEEELVRYAFQPIIRADNGEIFAYEALMRSQLENLKNPLHIIKLATADSRLYEIERLTFFKTLESFVQNRERFGDRKLFINSIPNYVLVNEDLEKFEKMYGRYLNNLVVEILENEHSDTEGTSEKINLISRWNSEVAIDDFGSGYNNESVLLTMTPNYVKIDMEIVRGVHKDLNRQQICKNLITYAKQRNIKIVAEGVEYIEELEKLIELGVDFIQGYFFSKPDFIPPVIAEEKKEIVVEINRRLKENMK